MPDTLSDNGFVGGSYDVTIDGYAYVLDTVDHDLPVSQADAQYANGTPKGALFVKGKQRLAVRIKAVSGVQAPSQLVPFSLAIHGYSSKYWVVTNLKITSANDGAVIRTYNADIVQHIATPT